MRKLKIFNLVVAGIAVILLIFAALYFTTVKSSLAKPNNVSPNLNVTTATDSNSDFFFFSEIFGKELSNPDGTERVGILEIILRLLLAVILSGILAFRPRKNVRLFERNLYVAQTQILLAVVAAALMMIVGDNAARAFAIFAAVSLVRFRTNIRDPKEVTVLLICLALGLAAGVGRWDLGIAFCLFVLVLLKMLEYKESDQAYRSMELTVKTRNTDLTQNTLKQIFDRFRLETEVRIINPPDETTPIGCMVYYLNLRLNLSTDYLSDQIFALDPNNIEGIQWEQKKSATDIYQ